MEKKKARLTFGYVYRGYKSAADDNGNDNIELLEKLDALMPELRNVIESVIAAHGKKIEYVFNNEAWGINKYSLRPVFGAQYVFDSTEKEVKLIKAEIDADFKKVQHESENRLLSNMITSFGVLWEDKDF
jgi:hypothetical protein